MRAWVSELIYILLRIYAALCLLAFFLQIFIIGIPNAFDRVFFEFTGKLIPFGIPYADGLHLLLSLVTIGLAGYFFIAFLLFYIEQHEKKRSHERIQDMLYPNPWDMRRLIGRYERDGDRMIAEMLEKRLQERLAELEEGESKETSHEAEIEDELRRDRAEAKKMTEEEVGERLGEFLRLRRERQRREAKEKYFLIQQIKRRLTNLLSKVGRR